MGWRLGPGELKRNRKKPRKGEGSVAEEGKSRQLSDLVSSNQTGEMVFRILRVDRADTPTYLSRGGLYSSKVRLSTWNDLEVPCKGLGDGQSTP